MAKLKSILEKIVTEEFDIDEIISAFHETFPNENSNNLKLICPTKKDEDVYYFSLDDKIIGLVYYETWFMGTKIELSTNGMKVTGKYDVDFFNTKLLDNSCDDISYELYPFEQCEEIISEVLIGKQKLKFLGKADDCDMSRIKIKNDMFLEIHNVGDVYKIVKNNKVISGFIDTDTNFQLGDGNTSVYEMKNGNILIENNGDVSSTVIIKFK